MDARKRAALSALAVLITCHLLLGLYASYDGGFFVYGLTAPERYLAHFLSSSESHISLTGAMKHVSEDLCLQKCPSCPMDCYAPSRLRLKCADSCSIATVGGTRLVSEGDAFRAVLKEGMLFEYTTFKCYGGDCGFDTRISETQTYSSGIPSGIKR
jgi:hypothetical protein